MTFANAFIALRRLRRGEVVDANVLVQLRRRGLVRGPLCIKRPAHGPRGHGHRAMVWERIWTITADGSMLLAFGDDALAWYDRTRRHWREAADVVLVDRREMQQFQRELSEGGAR